MAKQATHTELSSPEFNDETSSIEDKSTKVPPNRDSIKSYVTDVLTRHGRDDEQQTEIARAQIKIDPESGNYRRYENVSAFRQYHSNTEGTTRIDAQRHDEPDFTSEDDEDLRDHTYTKQAPNIENSATELNLDPNPLIEERESREQIYKQKVYLRQLQPPTPQPIDIQVQEVLLERRTPKAPLHVRVAQRVPRTPSPIVIKSSPPQPPPPIDPDQPIIYNKYVPPPKQPPQQIIIHHHPDLPPKPRPIVVEQWLPYKPAPKRIIKHTLPREALQTPPPPHNLIVSYAKPRALIEVELVRLPVVKIDPFTYQQMTNNGQQQLTQHPSFQHEQGYLSRDKSKHPSHDSNPLNWRI